MNDCSPRVATDSGCVVPPDLGGVVLRFENDVPTAWGVGDGPVMKV